MSWIMGAVFAWSITLLVYGLSFRYIAVNMPDLEFGQLDMALFWSLPLLAVVIWAFQNAWIGPEQLTMEDVEVTDA